MLILATNVMKIATYNLHFGGHTSEGNHWKSLLSEFQPDFICSQESFHPSEYFSKDEFMKFKGCIHRNVHHGRWGSAILSRNYELEEVSLSIPEFDGWVIGAKIHDFPLGDTLRTVLLFSIHAPSPGPYEPRVIRMIDAISAQHRGVPMIIAGDFNLTTAIRNSAEKLKNTPGELKILQRMQNELGLINAWQHLHPGKELPQTLRWNNKPLDAYHCDGIFISDGFAVYLREASVINHGVWGQLSDHNPILIEFA